MSSNTEIFYYISLAVIIFIVSYIIYITLHFQNNTIETFSLGGGGKDKKKKEKQSDASKASEIVENEIEKLQDAIDIDVNKEDIKDILENVKEYYNIKIINNIVKNSINGNIDGSMLEIFSYKFVKESLDEMINDIGTSGKLF